ncbi:MAG: hypothetical protein GX267_15770 [Fibrobacter sp.]|jgi:uncharacterized membrane protein|nr:hypothetical protein [Fibrobacter sp.]
MTLPQKEDILVQTSIVVNDSSDTLYHTWRDMRNFTAIFDFTESVIKLDHNRFRCTILIKDQNERLSLDLEVTEENPSNYFSWHSANSADFLHQGIARFIPQQKLKTEIQITLRFFFPPLQDSKAYMMGPDFKATIEDNLQRFKQAWEAKEFIRLKENLDELPDGLSKAPAKRIVFAPEKKKGDNQKNNPPTPYFP